MHVCLHLRVAGAQLTPQGQADTFSLPSCGALLPPTLNQHSVYKMMILNDPLHKVGEKI